MKIGKEAEEAIGIGTASEKEVHYGVFVDYGQGYGGSGVYGKLEDAIEAAESRGISSVEQGPIVVVEWIEETKITRKIIKVVPRVDHD